MAFTQDEWVAFIVALIGHYYVLYIVSAWSKQDFREKYEGARDLIRSFFAPPGWAVQPILFCVSAFLTASVFLFWRDHFASSSDRNFALVMSFHIASVFLMQLWSTSASWGYKWWWFTVGDSVLLTATSTVVWAIMGVEKAWLPFGLYSPLPVVAFLSIAVSSGFAVDSNNLTDGNVLARAGLIYEGAKQGGRTFAEIATGPISRGQLPRGGASKRRSARTFAMQ